MAKMIFSRAILPKTNILLLFKNHPIIILIVALLCIILGLVGYVEY